MKYLGTFLTDHGRVNIQCQRGLFQVTEFFLVRASSLSVFFYSIQ